MTTNTRVKEIREKILALKRPDNATSKYIIECELDDLLALFAYQLKLSSINAMIEQVQRDRDLSIRNYGYPEGMKAQLKYRLSDLTKQKEKLLNENN